VRVDTSLIESNSSSNSNTESNSNSSSNSNNSSSSRKSQLRAYVVECDGRLFLHSSIEVRLPCWDLPEDKDIDALLSEEGDAFTAATAAQPRRPSTHLWSDELENECCGKGCARPYNEGRTKAKTQRYALDECRELR
jgi:hypothetical protein